MDKPPIHGLPGTLISIFLFAIGKGFHKLMFINMQIIGVPLHQWLSDISLFMAAVVAILTIINNIERAYNNIAKWTRFCVAEYKSFKNKK